MKKRTTLVASLAAISLAALAGCMGGSGDDPTSDATGTAGSGSGTGGSEITGKISFQTWNLKASFQDYFEGLIADFEKQYPGTEVQWIDQPADGYADKLSADAAGNTLPDVINLDPGTGYPLGKAGMLVDLDKADPEAASDFLPEAWDAMDWKAIGGHYGYPWYLNTGPSLFNTALFTEAGLDPAKLPTTFDELFAQAGQMAQAAGGNYTMIGSSPTIEVMGMYGVKLMNDDQTEFTFNEPKGVELIEKYKQLYDEGGMLQESLSQTYTGQDSQFQSGKIAYMPGSAYNVKQVKENAPSVYEHLEVGPLITNEKPNMYIQFVSVNAASKNQATAIAFAKFVTNADNQLAFAKEVAIFPSTVGTLDDPYFTESDGSDDDEVRVQSAAQIKEAAVYSPSAFTEAMKTELRDQIALAIEGKKTAQEALDAAAAFANDRLSS